MNNKICGLSIPDEVNEYIRQRAEQEHRSLANVVAMIVIKYYNMTTSLPDEINEYIRKRAEQEYRSLSNVVAMMVIEDYNINYKEKENN